MAISTNESLLHITGWQNGSLFEQKQLFDAISYNASVYQGNEYNQGLSLSILDNNQASLTFNASDNGTARVFALAEAMFDPQTSKISMRCSYPLSGSYDPLRSPSSTYSSSSR